VITATYRIGLEPRFLLFILFSWVRDERRVYRRYQRVWSFILCFTDQRKAATLSWRPPTNSLPLLWRSISANIHCFSVACSPVRATEHLPFIHYTDIRQGGWRRCATVAQVWCERIRMSLTRESVCFIPDSSLYTTVADTVLTICRPQWPRGLRRGFAAACGFESRRRHGCLSLVSVVCCQAEVSASGWSLVLLSVVCRNECDREASIMRRFWPTRGCRTIGGGEKLHI